MHLSKRPALILFVVAPWIAACSHEANSSLPSPVNIDPSGGSPVTAPFDTTAMSPAFDATAHTTASSIPPDYATASGHPSPTHSTASVAPAHSSAPASPLDSTTPSLEPSPSNSPSNSPTDGSADFSSAQGEASSSRDPAAPGSAQVSPLPPIQPAGDAITFGTTLEAAAVMTASRQLAQSSVDATSPTWRAKGDQKRTYHSPETNSEQPFRLYVPDGWDGQSRLPLVMFLHGAGSDENTYVDQNDQQLVRLSRDHGFILVAPLGVAGAYGNFLRLSAPFGEPAAAQQLMSQVTTETTRANELSERDVINVLELVLAEYPVEASALYLAGHSMGSGGTWYIGGKYSTYWRALAPMSGPFVQETGYPWDNLSDISLLVTEGLQTPSLEASRQLGAWLDERGFDSRYQEVDADHGGMVPLVLPEVFAFFAENASP